MRNYDMIKERIGELIEEANKKRELSGLRPLDETTDEEKEVLCFIADRHPCIKDKPYERLVEILSWPYPDFIIDHLSNDALLLIWRERKETPMHE